jgi:outer membrane protein assembly factor BamB
MTTPFARPVRGLAAAAILLTTGLVAADDWPQWRGPARDGVWRETGLVERLPEGRIEPRWTAAIGSGYSGPTVAEERVFVMDRRVEPRAVERVLCFDWRTGTPQWTHEYECSYDGLSYDAGPRCSVVVQDGRAYALGAVGHLHCLDVATGRVIWSHDLRAEYAVRLPIWGMAATPVIEGDLLIVPVWGEGDAALVAFDVTTGAERWKALPDRGNYSAPIVIDQAGERVLVCWTGDRIVGVDPASGALHWEYPFAPKRIPLGIATPVLDGDTLFITAFYDGCVLLRLDQEKPAVEAVWRRAGRNEIRTDGLQSIISTPFVRDGHIYGVDSYGQMRCLDLETGERVWEDLTAVPKARWSTIHFVQNGDRTWMFNERGELLIGELSPEGFRELSRAALIEPTREQLNERGGVCWAHPAFAYRHVFARNDEILVCADLSAVPEPTTAAAVLPDRARPAAGDWPQWRGPQRDGISRETAWSSTGKPEPVWSRELGLGYSAVSVAGGRLYTMGYDEPRGLDRVYCLDPDTGAVAWTHEYPAKIWAQMHGGGTLTTPSVDGDVVYTLNREGRFHCFEAATGTVICEADLMKAFEGLEHPTWGFAASPLVLDDMIIVNVGRVVALKKRSTDAIWATDRNYGHAYSTPVDFDLDGRPCLAVFNGDGLAVLDRRSGKELYFREWKTQYEINAASPVPIGRNVFISSGLNRGATMLALGEDTVDVLWESRVMRNKMTGTVLWKGHLYGFDESILKCIDLEGNEKWRVRGEGNGSLMIADDRLIVINGNGELIIAKATPNAFEELSRQKVLDGGVCWTMPILVNGRIYCRNSLGRLVCIDHR